MATTVLSVATRAVIEACDRLGLDSDALLAAAQLQRSQVFDPDARLNAEQADAVWEAAAAAADDPELALHAAESLPDGAYRVLDFTVANAPSVGAALERIVRYFPIVDPRGQFKLKESPDEVRLEFRGQNQTKIPPNAQLYSFAAIVTRLRRASGLRIPLKRVEFDFLEPSHLKACKRIFSCDLVFQARVPALVFSPNTTRLELPRANADLLSILDAHADLLVQQTSPPQSDVAAQTRSLLNEELRGGEPSAEHVAKRQGLSERTLQRRLALASTTFLDLLAEVRQELAEEYLRSPTVSLTEIAWLLGFSESSAFSRAFKRWTGTSPATYRRNTSAPA